MGRTSRWRYFGREVASVRLHSLHYVEKELFVIMASPGVVRINLAISHAFIVLTKHTDGDLSVCMFLARRQRGLILFFYCCACVHGLY